MTPVDAAIEAMQAKATDIHVERARLEAMLQRLTDVAGFPGTVAAVQVALRRVAERERRLGRDLGGWTA